MKQLHNEECNKPLNSHKINEEIYALQKYEERLGQYEKLITKIIRNNDKAK